MQGLLFSFPTLKLQNDSKGSDQCGQGWTNEKLILWSALAIAFGVLSWCVILCEGVFPLKFSTQQTRLTFTGFMFLAKGRG